MKKSDAIKFVELLKETYPDATCSLDFTTPFQLVVAVMLSAQCTDERVNKTTPALFERCKTINDFANIDISELEKIIHPCGFYKNKAKNIKIILLEVFGIAEGVAVDTHAKRISNLVGLSKESEPEKIEKDLVKLFPKKYLKDLNHLLMWHGRNTCVARNPHCDNCSVKSFCNYYKNVCKK